MSFVAAIFIIQSYFHIFEKAFVDSNVNGSRAAYDEARNKKGLPFVEKNLQAVICAQSFDVFDLQWAILRYICSIILKSGKGWVS